ncbi:rubrerythrin-like domain-containing protein [Halapricum hydrolyticum]|uniref:Rubrerythrin-like domain-containing protein n=1 Tax=Halapricum hydrolyticum TaxID=2979991 RepID=A0AAE3IAL8_9EURY|nr:rubrerythrin-like domain-containing protein [Halapricum hydrolyticum]MCU4716837.1 rubrerythrin-like domain-containing protein [Halapricum hydrolyticum]MCU4725558.1 rubrerythrin-like domain-containing protein [Halapricum hydrolyticum]
MPGEDPYTPTESHYECLGCGKRITTTETHLTCPTCGSTMQNIAVPRE